LTKSPSIGDLSPDFKLPLQDGTEFSLSDFKGKNLVLFFFPKVGTAICTAEACSFRDNYQSFLDAQAQVIGISSDSKEAQNNFAQNHHLPYILLSDLNDRVRKLYGIKATLGIIPGRVTYVIDKKGIIRHIFNSQFNAQKHIDESLAILANLD
jgi:peroxiredoxin Q/BCP